jgi:hypothetical protein
VRFEKEPKTTFFFLVFCGGVTLSPLGTLTTIWPIVPAPDDDDDVKQSME